MIEIKNNGFVTINRGDAFSVPIFINAGTCDAPIRFKIKDFPNAAVLFSITAPHQNFNDGIIRKVFTVKDTNEYGDIMVELTSAETKNLPIGKYYYQFKLFLQDGKINTLTDRLMFSVR